MSEMDLNFPIKREAPFREWSPCIHYAQFQRMATGSLPQRRLYDFELLYVYQGKPLQRCTGTAIASKPVN